MDTFTVYEKKESIAAVHIYDPLRQWSMYTLRHILGDCNKQAQILPWKTIKEAVQELISRAGCIVGRNKLQQTQRRYDLTHVTVTAGEIKEYIWFFHIVAKEK